MKLSNNLVLGLFVAFGALVISVYETDATYDKSSRVAKTREDLTDDSCTGTSSEPFPDPHSCTGYYQCFYAWSTAYIFKFECEGYYNDETSSCMAGPCPNLTNSSCTSEAPFSDPYSCTSYYQCFYVNSVWHIFKFECAQGGYYDDAAQFCVEGTC